MKFHENISNNFSDIERTHVYGGNGHFQYSKGNTLKVGKQELQFMCSACHLMVLTFVSSFMKICQVVLKLWSGHKNY